MNQKMASASQAVNEAQVAAELGDYRRAETLMTGVVPGAAEPLSKFRLHMESYESAATAGDVRTALRALADARIALNGTGCDLLEAVINRRLQDVARLSRSG